MTDSPNRLKNFIQNPILQTIVIFISSSWIVLEITEYFIENFGLQESVRKILLIFLLAILPIALIIAWNSNRKLNARKAKSGRISISLKRRKILVPALLILLAIASTLTLRQVQNERINTALHKILPELQEEITTLDNSEGHRNWVVYHRAMEIKKILKNDPDFHQFWDDITVKLSIKTDPPGAKVYAQPYTLPDSAWIYMGESPLNEFSFPRGLSRLKIEKSGFDTQYDILLNTFGYHDEEEARHYPLYRSGEIPQGMIHAAGFQGNWFRTGGLPELYVGDFWIDRCEITNHQYKIFLDDDGYTNPSYWNWPFVENMDTISWSKGLERFKDNTGYPGPANWEMGDFPMGEENLPVRGISWYEAAAYASYVKKELPTVFHWTYLSEIHAAPEIIKFGNYNKRGPVEVGTTQAMTRFGTLDLAGNVSEWVFNSVGSNKFIMGGNSQEPAYLYNERYNISPWARSELIGFRCMRYLNDSSKTELAQEFERRERDFSKAEPVSDEAFSIIKALYNYESYETNVRTIATFDTLSWIQENILIDVPYENSPMQIAVCLPKNAEPPFQTVIHFPHDGPVYANSLDDLHMYIEDNDFFLKSGRAFVFPVYYNTFGRGDIKPNNTFTWRQVTVYMVSDFRFACDYLQTRSDIDTEKLAYYGVSWGGFMAPYVLAIEDRIKLGILVLFGASNYDEYEDLDQLNYLPRVEIPMLLLGGRYDFAFTLRSQEAFYNFLGTPENEKEWKLYESTHSLPRKDLVNESLAWLDKYLGPVEMK